MMKSREEILEILEKFLESLKKGDVTFLYDATGIWTASAKFQPVMEFQKAESTSLYQAMKETMGKG